MILFSSIRFKVTVWYMLILAVTLSVFSVFLYYNFHDSLYEDVNDLLRSRAEGVADAISTYWLAQRVKERTQDDSDKETANLGHKDFIGVANSWVKAKSNDPKLLNIIVRIFDFRGKEIAVSRQTQGNQNLIKKIYFAALKGESRYDSVLFSFSDGKPIMMRTFTMPVFDYRKEVSYIVQVSSPLSSLENSLNRLRFILLLLIPITTLIAGVFGEFLTRLALNPVDSMISTIRQISVENLKLRVDVPAVNDEITRLAETFNQMLGRLESSFVFERRFIQDISHELKTPLTILRGELEVALNRMRSPKEYESVLVSNLEEIKKISSMVENLLILAHFDNRDIRLELAPIDLSELMQELADKVKLMAQEKNIKINWIKKEQALTVGDRNHISRIFLNLLDNAIKYTPQDGEITIWTGKAERFSQVRIGNSGQGIDAKEIPYIFERFYRGDKSRSGSGFGLGLSISKSIVEAHNGQISVKSVLGQGVEFKVSLPVYQVT
jgi:heavy metal sensor kinase